MNKGDQSKPEQSVPAIKRPIAVIGETLKLRHVIISDAEFILSLRLDEAKNKHLSNTPSEVAKQKDWLEKYFASANQVYFIIEELAGEPIGTVRLHDPQGTSVHVGSWILKPGARVQASIESALLYSEFGFSCLGFRYAHFNVRKGNESVWEFFQECFGASLKGETDTEWLYVLSYEKYQEARVRYARYLPHEAKLVW